MSGAPDHDRAKPKPYLIEREASGAFRLKVRDVRYNSQNYPLMVTTVVAEAFATATAARAYAKEHLGAMPGEFALK